MFALSKAAPDPSLNADVPHAGLRPRRGRRLACFIRRQKDTMATLVSIARISALWLLASSYAAIGADGGAIGSLAWLAGCWRSETAEPGSGEQWMLPAGGTMLGMSRMVKQGKTVEHEFMQLRTLADGTLAFIAQPSGQRMTTFPLLRMTDAEVVFENPQHDFPQRVAYRLESRSKLVARIEGIRNGTLRVIEFPMGRASCEVPVAAPAR